jgi:creatinine amidohydrolase
MAENFVRHGFKRIVFINGHGGNDIPGRQVVFELRQRHRERDDVLFLFTTYWSLGTRPWETYPSLQQHAMGHACEWETSMILRIAPHLVGDYRAAATIESASMFAPASRGWITREISEPGHIGSPQLAMAEKGEHLLKEFTADVVGLLEKAVGWDGKSWRA